MRVGCPLTAQPAGSGGPPLASHHTDSMVEPMVDGRAPKGFNLYARTYSAPGLGVDGSLISAATCRMHRGTASPGEGRLPPCCRPRCCRAHALNRNSACAQTQTPNRGQGWWQCGAGSRQGKPGGARAARKQGPIPGRQGDGERQTRHERGSTALHCPITLRLGNKFKGNIRNGKIILKIIFFDDF